MKIIFLHPSMRAGGAERTIALLSDYLVRQGEEVTIITLDNESSFYKLHPKVCHIPLDVAAQSDNIMEAVNNNFKTLVQLRKLLQKKKVNLAVAFGANTILQLWLVKIGFSYKIIGSERTNPYVLAPTIWNKNKKRIAKHCNGFIFQTKGAQKYYPNTLIKKSMVLPNGIISDDFRANDIPWLERKNICAVGRMDKNKCFDDLIKSFSIVHKKHPQIILDLYGDGPLRRDLELLSQSLGLQSVVIFHGRCNDMYPVYAQHEFFLMASDKEGMPNVLMEAMASGCACISTDCDFGPSELIEHGKNGFLVPVYDVDTMAEYVCKVLEDDFCAQAISKEALNLRKTHNIEDVGAKFHIYLKGILG